MMDALKNQWNSVNQIYEAELEQAVAAQVRHPVTRGRHRIRRLDPGIGDWARPGPGGRAGFGAGRSVAEGNPKRPRREFFWGILCLFLPISYF